MVKKWGVHQVTEAGPEEEVLSDTHRVGAHPLSNSIFLILLIFSVAYLSFQDQASADDEPDLLPCLLLVSFDGWVQFGEIDDGFSLYFLEAKN